MHLNWKRITTGLIVGSILTLLLAGLYGTVASAHTGSPAMAVWTNGQTLTAAKLNEAFAHIHNTLSGGIVNENISASAAISHSKLAAPALVPKAVVLATAASGTLTPCDGSSASTVCAIYNSFGVTSVKGSGTTGIYNVLLSFVPKDNQKLVLIAASNEANSVCAAEVQTTGSITSNARVWCTNKAGTATNSRFSLVVWEN